MRSIRDSGRIGFAGLGRMGAPMCANLVRAGRTVATTDIRPEAVVAGARPLPGMADLAAESDVLITMLPGPREVTDAMAGAVDALRPGAVWIDMTSNDPAATTPVRERVLARGAYVLEAPVGGGVEAARAGTLRIFAGGEEAVFARCRPILEILADPAQIVRVGGHGAGYTAKLLVNLLWFGQAVATAEALLLGASAGLDLGTLRRVLAGSAAGSEFIRRDLTALFAGDYLTSFGLDRCLEELTAVTGLARAHGVPFALSELVEDTYRRALDRFGPVDGELLAVALLEERADRRLRHPYEN
ncbi:NAD(P)-dependent oxidoreductase [Actinoallomurus iriomotensis]|uniref:3-hydroxyisobutyrate dehydrogenase n=1 Tax=Actinoallomurus iriomotensis TaxID=478107 RepID=A0A9W6VWF6_9ACTN|nr:NAD(P)-dependent oxidoreductase [Actinoallomurus iriomotensis]GLY80721.1 3-hydroxyisobutyrate dehydrogenase [Actinoallomurus iriomotensis]